MANTLLLHAAQLRARRECRLKRGVTENAKVLDRDAAGAVVLMAASSAAFAAPDDHRVSVGRAIAPLPLDQINTDGYLCGGTPFGPVVSADISRDEDGLPAGLMRPEFIRLLRTEEEEDGELLQVMPWPVYGKVTRRDRSAVYTYLSAGTTLRR